MNKKKILTISHMYPRKNRGNYGIFVYEQVKAMESLLGKTGKVSVVSPVQYSPWPLFMFASKWLQYRKTEKSRKDFGRVSIYFPRYICFPRKILRSVAARSCYWSLVKNNETRKLVAEADVIVSHTALFDGWVARILAKSFGKEYVIFIHGEDLFQNTYGFRNIIKKVNIKRILRDSKKIVTVSSYMRRAISESYGFEEKTHVLHNGVDLAIFCPNRRKRFSELRLISAGFLIQRKANEHTFKALADLHRKGIYFKQTIAGDGPERKRLECLADELGIKDRINFLGAYNHQNFPKILEKHDLFVLPSWDEAFGVVYVEAMAMGLPVIAADDMGAVDIVTEGVDGYLVSPKKPIAIEKAILSYANLSVGEKEIMSENAIKKSKRFTWEVNAKKLLELLEFGELK